MESKRCQPQSHSLNFALIRIGHITLWSCAMASVQVHAQQGLQEYATLIKNGVREVCATTESDLGHVQSKQLYVIDSMHVILKQMNSKGRVKWVDTLQLDPCIRLPFLATTHYPPEIWPCGSNYGPNGVPLFKIDSTGLVLSSSKISAVDVQQTGRHHRFEYLNRQLFRSIEWSSKYGHSMGDTIITVYEHLQGRLHSILTQPRSEQEVFEVLYEYSPTGLLLHMNEKRNGHQTRRISFTYIIR